MIFRIQLNRRVIIFVPGLRVTLNIDLENYVGMFSHRAGVAVAIHAPNITAFPEDDGIMAAPGHETLMGVRAVRDANTVKPVYNDHLMGYFSAFWCSSRWPWAT